MRISSPPFLWPCYYGTDVPSRGELIAVNHTVEEICKLSGADTLGYLPARCLDEMLGGSFNGYCDACFTGLYPAPITKLAFKGKERGGMTFNNDDNCASKEENNE